MRMICRRSVTVLATYAVALHVILLGFVPVSSFAYGLIDPFAIICHATGASANPGEPPPGTLHIAPGRAIDQCDLCSAAAPPPAPDIAFYIDFSWSRVLQILQPVSTPVRSSVTSDPKLTRGPPLALS
jgi:hypothetical protein